MFYAYKHRHIHIYKKYMYVYRCVYMCSQSCEHIVHVGHKQWPTWTIAHQAPLSMEFSCKNTEVGCICYSRGSSWPRDWTHVSCTSCIGRQISTLLPGSFWTARRSNQSILKEISPGYSLEGLMLKLKLQYFGRCMRRVDSLEKTLMLGRTGGMRRRGRQRMRWLTDINGHDWLNGHGFG